MTNTLTTPAAGPAGPAVTRLDVGAFTIATDVPESDGTIAWDATTIVVVEVHAGDTCGLGDAYTKATLTRIMQAAGAQDILTIDRYAHLVGGCRMGTSPQNSVVDADHRVWGVPNLFVCDGSVMPTQGSANPALTIMALASRLAGRLAAKNVDPASAAVAA